MYKISVIENITDNLMGSFYMDWRTSDWNSSLDVTFNYDVGNNRFRNHDNTETIDYSYQTLWDLTDNTLETSGLENYWSYSLAMTIDGNGHPRLVWGPHPTFSTTNYYLYRGIVTLPYDPKTQQLIFSPWILSSSTYEFTDNQFVIGGSETYRAYYYVKAYNSANSTFSSASNTVNTKGVWNPDKISIDLTVVTQPLEFSLTQNYPNPFNPSTTIEYTLPEKNYVSLKIYDILGREITTLVDEVKEVGTHSVKFNASELTSGIYLYKFQSSNYLETRKMILLK